MKIFSCIAALGLLTVICNPAGSETVEEKMDRLRNFRPDFVYTATPNAFYASFLIFRAVEQIQLEMKKDKNLATKEIKEIMVRRRNNKYFVTLFPYDAYDRLNADRQPIADTAIVQAIVDVGTLKVLELNLCSGECRWRNGF